MTPPAIPRMPSRIGPYRLLARLASGGMAEVHLAKMSGAAGFERVVVIKRSLPHLAHEPELRSALLDEARIMSRIRHPNVVSVQELAEDHQSFYLVMEYLRGENLSGLTRALRARSIALEPSLAVLIAAEICAGLHAAHELVDDDGRPLHVVHRDVSPQNVFVTFDGEVKLLDFGIARYDDRAASRTRTGICKGKFAYMAPEQYGGDSVDRRADVFATGVILHELLTGERLFQRETEVKTLRAILDERYPSPREKNPDVAIGEELEEIVMKALARDRAQRFPSAEAMRLALRSQLRQLDPDQDGRERLIELTRRVLPDRLAETQDRMRRAREDSSARVSRPKHVALVPPPKGVSTKAQSPLALASERESGEIVLAMSDIEIIDDASGYPASLRRSPLRTIALFAAAAAAVLLGLAGAAVLPRATANTNTVPSPAEAASPAPAVWPPPAPVRSATVRLHVEATPRGARVSLGGEPRCEAPCDLELPRSAYPVDVMITHDGYAPEVDRLIPEIDQRLVVSLVRAERRRELAPRSSARRVSGSAQERDLEPERHPSELPNDP